MDKKTYMVAGASRGIGFAIATQLLDEGHTVIACCRQPQWSDGSKILSRRGADVRALDILSDESITNYCENMATDYPHIDCLINCIGVLHETNIQPEKQLKNIKRSSLQRIFDSNAFGHILLIQALEPLLSKAKEFTCVSISARVGSIADNQIGGWYSYRASKAALNMLLKTLSIEFERKYPGSSRILSLHPGTTDTQLSKPFQSNVSWKLYSPEDTAKNLLSVIASAQGTGQFLAFDGSSISF